MAINEFLASIIVNREKLKSFQWKSGMGQGCHILHSQSIKFFKFYLTIRHKKQKGIKTRNQEVILSLFINDVVIYIRDVNESTILRTEELI